MLLQSSISMTAMYQTRIIITRALFGRLRRLQFAIREVPGSNNNNDDDDNNDSCCVSYCLLCWLNVSMSFGMNLFVTNIPC